MQALHLWVLRTKGITCFGGSRENSYLKLHGREKKKQLSAWAAQHAAFHKSQPIPNGSTEYKTGRCQGGPFATFALDAQREILLPPIILYFSAMVLFSLVIMGSMSPFTP